MLNMNINYQLLIKIGAVISFCGGPAFGWALFQHSQNGYRHDLRCIARAFKAMYGNRLKQSDQLTIAQFICILNMNSINEIVEFMDRANCSRQYRGIVIVYIAFHYQKHASN